MIDTQYKVILEEIRKIGDHISDIDIGLEKDRENIQDLTIRLENVESEIKETRKAINASSEKIKSKVSDVVEGVIESSDRLSNQLKKSKKVFIYEPKSWLKKFFYDKDDNEKA